MGKGWYDYDPFQMYDDLKDFDFDPYGLYPRMRQMAGHGVDSAFGQSKLGTLRDMPPNPNDPFRGPKKDYSIPRWTDKRKPKSRPKREDRKPKRPKTTGRRKPKKSIRKTSRGGKIFYRGSKKGTQAGIRTRNF